MTAAPGRRMNAADFLDWAAAQPRGRWELAAGEPVAMAPERATHARVKAAVHRGLERSIAEAGLACEAFPDGMAVLIDDATVYEPDASVRCGAPLDGDATSMRDPVLVVEVLSPSTRARDSGAKLEDYFRLPGLVHYLILKTDTRTVIHHRRVAGGEIATSIRRDGALDLDPPGLRLDVADLFARV